LQQKQGLEMSSKGKLKYMQKSVKFRGAQLTLYSLDGMTWSSRKQELTHILERQETQRITFGQIKGGPSSGGSGASKSEDGEEKIEEEEFEEDQAFLLARQDVIDDEVIAKPKGGKARVGVGRHRRNPVPAEKVKPKAKAKAKAKLPAKKAQPSPPAKTRKSSSTPKSRASGKETKKAKPKSKRRAA